MALRGDLRDGVSCLIFSSPFDLVFPQDKDSLQSKIPPTASTAWISPAETCLSVESPTSRNWAAWAAVSISTSRLQTGQRPRRTALEVTVWRRTLVIVTVSFRFVVSSAQPEWS
jgi:hypothetical protein